MAKKKKNKKKSSLWKSVKPFVKDNQTMLTLLGAVGAGAALTSFIGSEKVREWIGQASEALSKESKRIQGSFNQDSSSKVKPVTG
ncbi:hypothetical protein [Xanthocytophaga flava]|uniref:hypothetical protein n=1 Tax=Xanthocytophaga flava TaxID=3048013 RepID=UPI0028D7C39B|nr:hypothetical protein [Xanthocytophaga flavus]MDJ1470292.1 hypothetical protein [Xanthocytophaga flavus]